MRHYREIFEAALRLGFLYLFLLLPVASVASSSCDASVYSHRTGVGKAWLEKRLKSKNVATLSSERWSKSGQVTFFPRNKGLVNVDEMALASNEFLKWLHGGAESLDLQHFSISPMERPGFKSEEGSLVLASYATGALNKGATVLDLPLELCLSDASSPGGTNSLQEAPWEVRLASKLLHERSKGSTSRFASYIKTLPEFVFLPMFFTDLELNNIQDTSVQEEVHKMRRFIEVSFQSLDMEEVAGANFKELAWAMAIVYSSTCELTLGDSVIHILIPFISSASEPSTQLNAVYLDGRIKLVANEEISNAMSLSMAHNTSSSRDLFVFHGVIPNNRATTQLFTNVLDLVDWYVSTYGGVNNNRYLTHRVAQDAREALSSELSSGTSQAQAGATFLLDYTGQIDPYIVCIFATLFYAKELLNNSTETESIKIAHMDSMPGTPWEMKVNALMKEFISTDPLTCQKLNQVDKHIKHAVSLALAAILACLQSLLGSFSTTLEEDKALLVAASWEGFGGTGLSQSGCATCRWQIEEMSFNDYLAVLYRSSHKALLQKVISQRSCLDSAKLEPAAIDADVSSSATTEEFMRWMEGNEFIISEKLAISHLKSGDGSLVRGVVVRKDIRQGETLCNLPLNMGLYDNETVIAHEVDAWDRAAARVLREKAKGNSSSWAAYINVLPRQSSVPILLEDHELVEVQWWPVVRELVQVRKSIRESFSLLSKEDLGWAVFDDYRWAAIMVHSRAFTLPVTPDEQYAPYVMMPYMDMINHHYHYQADWTSQPIWGGKLEIVARREIQKGEELFASFGPRANDNLFLYYGFVLDGNPFDITQIFDSYEEGVRWFLKVWTASCKQLWEDPGNGPLCKRRQWETHWKIAKQALGSVPGRGAALNRDWWGLVSQWADLGYEYIPYQPGPTIYSQGVIDPSLVALFESLATVIELPYHTSATAVPVNKGVNVTSTASRNETTKGLLLDFLSCMKEHIRELSTRALVDGHTCWDKFEKMYSSVENSARSLFLGRLSASLRCLEVLALFPTTLEEDRLLIEQDRNASSRSCRSGLSCSGEPAPSEHLKLTRRYRYLKKLMLQEVVNRLLSWWQPSLEVHAQK